LIEPFWTPASEKLGNLGYGYRLAAGGLWLVCGLMMMMIDLSGFD
jgi:hypothetical protein